MATMNNEGSAPTVGQILMMEVRELRQEVATLRQFADLLGKADGSGNSFMAVVVQLLSHLIAGTEKTHGSLEALHSLMVEPTLSRSIRRAISND